MRFRGRVKAGKMETDPVQKYSGRKGKQKPQFYKEVAGTEIFDFLESKSLGGEFEPSGQTFTNTQADEEALEVNWLA